MELWVLLETLNKLRLNSPPGGWFPALQDLYWYITESDNSSCTDLFFPPHLKKISIRMTPAWDHIPIPPGILPILTPIILTLPTSGLEQMSVGDGHQTMAWAHFKDEFSSVILRCGLSFREYDSPVPLSDAALHHLIHLPHLHTWRIHGPPPTYPASSLPLVFPPLRELTLGKGAARGWLPLLRRLEEGTATPQGVTPLSKAKEFLQVLNVEDVSGINTGACFVSKIQCFRNLVDLNAEFYCYDSERRRRQCIFELNNDNVTELAMALTQLEFLLLGHACSQNTCLTTVACLLSISVHCNKMEELEIHFNTTNIVNDFKSILEDPKFQQLRSLPRCSLTCLGVNRMPLDLDESGFDIVAKGMNDIFPSLVHCNGRREGWGRLTRKFANIQGTGKEPTMVVSSSRSCESI